MPTLDFKGKQFIYGHHLTVPIRTLEMDAEKSLTGEEQPSLDDNLIIHGNNLDALKALLSRYAGRIKCIYIDPPYNTGKEGWVYNDNVNSPLAKAWLEKNKPIDAEDMERHDKWLFMMWPRLHLLKELLSDDGAIFISIDDNEQHRLRMLMDDIFDSNNFIANIAVVSNLAGSSDQFGFAGAHEHCLVYAKNRQEVVFGSFDVDQDELEKWEQDDKGYYKPEALQRSSLSYSESLDYPIFVCPEDNIEITDDDSEPDANGPYTAVYPVASRGNKRAIWRWSKRKIRDNPGDVFVRRRRDGSIGIYSKQRPQLGDMPTEKPKSVFYKPEYSSRAGGEMLSQILPDSPQRFPYPKAVTLIEDLLRIGAPNAEDIILDSFAGSGTTAQAALALNKKDGGTRKFILVECKDYADTTTAERVRRVINGVENATDQALREGFGGTFTYCTLGEPIDAEGMLTGEKLPTYEALANYIVATATGKALPEIVKQPDYFFGEIEGIRFYLIYEPTTEFLDGTESALDASRAEQIAEECQASGKKAYVYATHKFISQKELTGMNITFCQLPYNIYRITE